MDCVRVTKETFAVLGKLGSTDDGPGFVANLWAEANGHFNEIAPLVKKDAEGRPAGIWGLMSDFSGGFAPWEEGFTRGLYLAGAEADDAAQPPEGWVRWVAPAAEYLKVKITGDPAAGFGETLAYMEKQGLALAGAVYDFNDPAEGGQLYMFFPLRRL